MRQLAKYSGVCAASIPGLTGLSSDANADNFYFGFGTCEAEVSLDNFDENDNVEALFIDYTFIDSVIILSAELGKYRDGGTEVEADAISLAALASLALGPFVEVYARAGIASVDGDTNGGDFDDEDSFQGIGIGLDVLDTIDLYAEYPTFDTEVDSEMIGIGLRFDFQARPPAPCRFAGTDFHCQITRSVRQ